MGVTVVGTKVAIQSPEAWDLIPGLCHGCCLQVIWRKVDGGIW